MRTSLGRCPEPRRSRIRCLGTVGRLDAGGRNRVGALGGFCTRGIDPSPSDRNPRAPECPIDPDTGVSLSGDDSSASIAGAGNSSGTSAMLSPTRAPAARRISPNAAAELGRRAGSVFNPSSNAEQTGSGTPLARRSGIGPAITRRANAMGLSPF